MADTAAGVTARDGLGDLTVSIAQAVVDSSSLETLSRPFLDMLHGLTGLESTYLTEVRPTRAEQRILFADNRGGLTVPEGHVSDWNDSLCRRALESDTRSTSDVPTDLPGSVGATRAGMTSYVSVPVIRSDDVLIGTLCGASTASVAVSEHTVQIMTMLGRLIADRWERDQQQAASEERARQAEERLVTRTTFLAEAEHKLKSPLTIIRGWSELLVEEWTKLTDEERLDGVRTVRRAAVDASGQVEQLLDEARSEVLSLQLLPVTIDLPTMIAEVAHQIRGAASSLHVVTSGRLESSLVTVDREALWQVLWHLAENALKYSPEGGTIDIGCTRIDTQVAITVSDEGLGLPIGVDVFAPFTRGPGAASSPIKGTGLGLHIVRTLVRAMGGSVTAERRPLRGSILRVVLPLADETTTAAGS